MCSRVFWRNGKLVSRTMDLPYFDEPRIYILPKGIENKKYSEYTWKSKYDSLVINEVGTPDIISEGMNECGLAAHLLSLLCAKYPRHNYCKPTLHFGLWVKTILDQASTVQEAINLHNEFCLTAKYKTWPILGSVLENYAGFHLAIEDVHGDCAVIEYVDGSFEPKIYRGYDAAVVTNEPTLDCQLQNVRKYYPFGNHILPGGSLPQERFVRLAALKELLIEAPSSISNRLQTINTICSTAITPGCVDDVEYAIANVSHDIFPTTWRVTSDLENLKFYFIADGSHRGIYRTLEIDLKKYLPVKNIKVCMNPYTEELRDYGCCPEDCEA